MVTENIEFLDIFVLDVGVACYANAMRDRGVSISGGEKRKERGQSLHFHQLGFADNVGNPFACGGNGAEEDC